MAVKQIALAGGFKAVAADFAAVHRKSLEKEQAEQDAWLAVRAKQITGDPRPVAVQTHIFAQDEAAVPPQVSWMPVTDPAERLAKFYADCHKPTPPAVKPMGCSGFTGSAPGIWPTG